MRESEFVCFGQDVVCASCKPIYLQRRREGVTPTLPRVRDLSVLTQSLKALLLAGNVATFLGLTSASVHLAQLLATGQGSSDDELTFVAVGEALLGLLQLVAILAVAVLFLRWIYLANTNVRVMGAGGLRYSPRGAIVWYFVPIASLWKPYQAMKEIWQASMDPANWRRVRTPKLLPIWWTLWLVSLPLSNASMKAGLSANDFTALLASRIVEIASDLVDLPLNFLAIALLTRIWTAQQRKNADGFPTV